MRYFISLFVFITLMFLNTVAFAVKIPKLDGVHESYNRKEKITYVHTGDVPWRVKGVGALTHI